MEFLKFGFWEVMKSLGLVLLGLLAAKAAGNLRRVPGSGSSLPGVVIAAYAVIAGLVGLGARAVGYDVAAQLYAGASQDDLAHAQYSRAYENALRAVQLRPGSPRNWRALAISKIAQRQFASAIDDLPAIRSLNGEELDEEDAYRFALCHFYLGEYEEALLLTRKLVSRNRFYAAPFVLQGMTYTAEKKYRDAELSFLDILQTFPSHQAAVEGLAHAYFLEGNRGAAVSVLEQTAQHPFSAEARKRFEALKALYAQ